jgi:S-adenosylmethionine decarboxylase
MKSLRPQGVQGFIILGYSKFKGGLKLHALGTHLLIELKDCTFDILKDVVEVKNAMVEAALNAKATIVDVSFHQFSPFGVSGMVVIAESHLSIHTWPEYNYAAVDIFTCGDIIKPEEAAEYLIDRFGSKNPSIVEMKRGIISCHNEKLPHKVCSVEEMQYELVS